MENIDKKCKFDDNLFYYTNSLTMYSNNPKGHQNHDKFGEKLSKELIQPLEKFTYYGDIIEIFKNV